MFQQLSSRSKALSRSAGAILPLLGLLCSVPAQVAAQPFAQASLPAGIATDPKGNVYIASMDTGSGSGTQAGPVITKLDPSGKQVYQLPLDPNLNKKSGDKVSAAGLVGAALPGPSSPGPAGAGRLVYDPMFGVLWYLSPAGQVLYVNPDKGAAAVFGDLQQQQFDTTNAVDVTSGSAQAFAGKISLQQATWGDIAVLWLKTDKQDVFELDFFLTAVAQGVPLAARLRLTVNTTPSVKFALAGADVLVASLPSGPNPASPTGIAVAPQQEMVLTTLPVASGSGGTVEHLVFFPASLGLQQGGSVTVSKAVISSRGMSSDDAGNIYVATGPSGAAGCGDSNGNGIVGGALVVLFPNGSGSCYSPSDGVDAQDSAVSADSTSAYVTLGQQNAVVKVDLPPPQQGPKTPGAAASPSGMRSQEYHGSVLRGQDSNLKGRLLPLQ